MNLATQYPETSIKALIVDDQMLMRRAFARILFEMGVESIEECSNAEDGIRKLKRIPEINLVICDLRMDKLTGFDVLTYLRTRPIHSDVPFLLVTGDSEQEVIVKAKDLGVSDFGIKPIMPEDLKKKIWKMMESYLNPSETEKLFHQGDQLFLAGNYQKAMSVYKATTAIEASARSYYSMAQVLMRANKIDAADNLVKENIKKYPLYYKNYALAADISILKKDYYTAIDYLKKELNINPWQPHRCCLVGGLLD
ncbi:MAG: response regulator [Oligoflexales bacterium]